MEKNIAVLLTCHNRRKKTIRCLDSLYRARCPVGLKYSIFLVDDGSSDGTATCVSKRFPCVHIIQGSGSLFWAGGMRLAWRTAMRSRDFDAFLLLNDDVELAPNVFELLFECHNYAIRRYGKGGLYSAATLDKSKNQISYGGQKITKRSWRAVSRPVVPLGFPQELDTVNANILWVESNAVEQIGILSDIYTHGIADYDYGLRAKKANLPVLLAADSGGFCVDDHGRNYLSRDYSFNERLAYLKSPTGLAYKEYLSYIWRHFPLALPYSFLMLWAKTIFPEAWERYR